MKTLIVQYLPREDYSHTKKLLDTFKDGVNGEIQLLDLLEDQPEFLDTPRVMAYIHQNYMGQELEAEEKGLLLKMEKFARDVREADYVVLATPMYNFSYPALVKAWFDSVMCKGITFDTGAEGQVGLCTSGKAALLFASGGAYHGDTAGLDHLTPIVAQSFGFMGFCEFHSVTAGGFNLPGSDPEKIIAEAQEEVRSLTDAWYNQ